jgi:LysM repeat protein
VVTLFFLAVALAALVSLGERSTATGEAGARVPTTTVIVDEGDTLWGIAGEVAEPGQVRELVHRIMELNALSSATLHEGQELAVPTG